VNEISFTTSANLSILNKKLKLLKECVDQKYGNLHGIYWQFFATGTGQRQTPVLRNKFSNLA